MRRSGPDPASSNPHSGAARLPMPLLGMSVLAASVWGVMDVANAFGSGRPAAKPTVITVTMGKPTEFQFKLSKTDLIPAGKVTFKVTNLGVINHDFRLCKAVFTAKALANACVGALTTKTLRKGQTQTLTVTLKKGKFEFLSSLSGHAKNGMKGLLGVGVTLTKSPPECGSSTACVPSPDVVVSCAETTVNVDMRDGSLNLSQWTIPCGAVTFVERNLGSVGHRFSIAGKHTGAIIPPGMTASVTVTLPRGNFPVGCDVEDHAAFESGTLTVTAGVVTTTAAKPPAGAPPTALSWAPPPAWVETALGSRWLGYSSFCWVSGCADYAQPRCDDGHTPTLLLGKGELVIFHLGFAPKDVSLLSFSANRRDELAPARTVAWRVTDAGAISLFARAETGGDASYVACVVFT
jgi:uncharacterized cupredoxin-like copper-binding protein